MSDTKTARDLYPQASDELFEMASMWVCHEYSYVPYMEPARDGFIAGYLAATTSNNQTHDGRGE